MGDGGFVWSDDDGGSTEDEADGEAEETRADTGATEEADAPSPFEDLLDRIGGSSGGSTDVDDLSEFLPPGSAFEEPGDIERLLERAADREEDGERTPSTSDGSNDLEDRAEDGPTDLPDGLTDRLSDDAAGSGSDAAPLGGDTTDPAFPLDDAPDHLPDVDAEEPASDVDDEDDDSADRVSGNPFSGLVDRMDRDVASRRSRGRGRSTGAAGDVPTATGDPAGISEEASSVLLLGSSDGGDGSEACLSLLGESRPKRTNLLLVWLSRDVADRLQRLYESYADESTTVTVVCRSKVGRSIHQNPAIPTDSAGGNLTIERISDPRDLPKLGIAISQVIKGWAGSSKHTVMCFDSITDLLQFASHERVFRFLHVLQGRIDSIDATAHYHLDRDAHEERTVAMFWNLFDDTLDLSPGDRAE